MAPAPQHVTDFAALARAVDDGSLELLYQPEVELATGGIVGMEGLLRWHSQDLGALAPPSFLAAAEQSGDLGAITEWVLREGAAEAARWTDLPDPQRRLWLNVSAPQVRAAGFVELVAAAVADSALPAGALGLELTEADVLQLDDAPRLLGRLRDAGVALAVDHFSTWYATLGAIDVLPVDAVKLSQRYVRGVGEDVDVEGSRDGIAAAVIEQAHRRGLYVVAEGVETWGEAARLTELGCDRAHGWLFASAQRADRARWLLQHGAGWRRSTVPVPRHSG